MNISYLVTVSLTFLLFLLENMKVLSVKDILGHIVMVWTGLNVTPFQYLLDQHDELQYCLGASGLEVWDINKYCPDVCLSQLVIDLHLQGFLFSSSLFPTMVLFLKDIGGVSPTVPGVLDKLYIRVFNFCRYLIKVR